VGPINKVIEESNLPRWHQRVGRSALQVMLFFDQGGTENVN
jgi:hypothetical protein